MPSNTYRAKVLPFGRTVFVIMLPYTACEWQKKAAISIRAGPQNAERKRVNSAIEDASSYFTFPIVRKNNVISPRVALRRGLSPPASAAVSQQHGGRCAQDTMESGGDSEGRAYVVRSSARWIECRRSHEVSVQYVD